MGIHLIKDLPAGGVGDAKVEIDVFAAVMEILAEKIWVWFDIYTPVMFEIEVVGVVEFREVI